MSRWWPVLIFLWCVATAPAQETPLPLPEEAPEALLQTTIGSSDVEMFLDGSWSASASGVAGFLLRSGQGIEPLDVFPSLPLGFNFTQEPQLTFSVWLQKHYFVEFSVLGSFEDNAFRAGYESDAGLLRSLVVGNRGIAIDPYPYLTVPETGDSSLGAEATLVSGASRHEFLVRYDNNSSGTKIFVGKNEVEEFRIPLAAYAQGLQLRLPDAGVDGLRLYLEDPDGSIRDASDGRRYRVASTDDAIADAVTGIITLKQRPFGRVLAYYTRNGLPVGDPALGGDAIATVNGGSTGAVDPDLPRDFFFADPTPLWPGGPLASTLQVAIEGHTALLLRERGVFSLFDVQGSYLVNTTIPQELWRVVAKVVERDGTQARGAQPKAVLRVDPDLQRLVATLVADTRDLRNLYPLLDEDPTAARLYGPFRDDSAGLYSREILLQVLTPVETYVLEPDILAGSVSVTRNGNPETRFSVEAKTGVITFVSPIGPADRLEITYKKKGALLDNGDLVLAWGNRFPLSEAFAAELAAGFRWNALPGAYSEKPFTRTGAVLLSGGVTGRLDNFDLDAEAAVSYAHPDTTGRLRLAGMEASGLDLSLDENLALPASEPGTAVDPADLERQANRGKLLYKNYREYGLLGSFTLQGPDWDIPSSQVYPYESGSKIGPYNVAGGNGDVDRSLVLDFDLQPGQWAGFEIPILPGQPLPDLSSIEALITEYRMLEVTGTVDVSVQIGDVAEDVDGDKILDEEPSASATGFLFNDSGNGVTLLVGGGPKGEGNGRKDTEDLDGDRYLQTGDGDAIVAPAEFAAPAGGWTVRRNPIDAASRKLLRRARAIRVFVRETTSLAAAKGRLLIDKLFLAGSTFAVTDSTDGTASAREVPEQFAGGAAAPKSLENAFKDVVKNVFHAGGETQEVLEIETGTSQEWTVRGFTTTATEGARYREVVHYLRVPQWNPGAPLAFELLDDRGRGIHWSFTASAFPDWREVRVDTEKRRLTIDGAVPAGASVRVDSYGSLVQFRILSKGGDGSNGLLFVDELHMASPIGSVGAAVGVDTELRVPGPLLQVRGVPVVSDLRVREIANGITPGFSPLYGRPTPAWGGSSRTELGMALPASQLDTHFVIDWTDAEATIGGGHTLQTTVGPVSVLDSFDLSAPGPSAAFDRESRLRVTPAPGTALDAGVQATTSDDRLTQTWSGTLSSAASGLRASLVTDLGLSTLGYVHREHGYFDSWILGYRLYAPVEAPLIERTSSATLETALDPRPVGIALQLTPSTRSVPSGDGREQRDALMARLAAPMALDDRGTLLTAAYQRELESTATQPAVGSFDADWTELAANLASQTYLTSGVPFWELYASDEEFRSATADATSALYRPQIQLELERRPGSRIAHLFLPTRMEASLARDLEKAGALYSSLYVYSLAYQANAINLFGRLGAYPTFTFYDLDEISNGISLALSFDRNESLENADLRLDSLVGLEGGGGNQFTLSNRLSVTGTTLDTVENTTSASYTWFVRPAGGVRLPLLAKDITSEAFYAHDESLELTTSWGPKPATGLVRHRTEIRIPGHGHIAATAALGVDFETFRAASGHGRDWVIRFAAQAGIEALITFGSGEPKRVSEPAPRAAEEGRPP